jgi:hypothetical protein
MVLYTDSASDSESASSPGSRVASSSAVVNGGVESCATSTVARTPSPCTVAGVSMGVGAEATTGGHVNCQSLRIFSTRYFLTASLFLVLSLLTRSASISSGGGTPWGKELRNLVRVVLGDLYRSEKIMVDGVVSEVSSRAR